MNFEVIRQTIRRTDSAPIIADSINYLTAKFRFSSDWADLEKHVTFTLGTNVYDKTLDADDEIKADQGLNLTEGIWTIGIVGVEVVEGEMVERITADTVTVLVTAAGALGGEAFPEISGAFGEIILQSEADRVAAEAARVAAEEEREAYYAAAQTGFDEDARVAAENLRVEAENARELAEEARESFYQDAQTGFDEAARVAAENLRIEAESAREVAEGLRDNAEQSRDSAEGIRVTAEQGRGTAEGLRVTAESSRDTAEGLRVTAEGLRDMAEQARDAAEDIRIAAESARAFYAAYSGTTSYILGNKVSFNGSSYIWNSSTPSVAGTQPPSTGWLLIASRGDDGLDGADGSNGSVGPAGPAGATGPAGPNSVSTSTDSSITGLLKGSGGKVTQAVAGEDYVAAESDPYFIAAASAASHYTGFPNRTDTALSFSGTTFTLTASSDAVWVNGVSYTINTLTKALTAGQQAVSGIYWFWITAPAGVPQLNCDINAPGFDKCLVATVYWNATTAAGIVTDERHWMGRDQMWHANVHGTQGARYASGMAGTFGNSSISIGAGTFYDEDIPHTWVSPLTTVRVLYHDGSDAWKWDVLTTPYKVVNPGVDNKLRYNNGTALATVQNNRYANYWVYATGDAEYPINVILGTAEYTTLTSARAATPPSFGALISAEAKLIYRLTYQNNSGTPAYNSATDYRVTASSGAAYVATDHGSLTGLNDLDHPASAIRYTPSTYVSSTTTQGAIDEIGNLIGDFEAALDALLGV